MLKFFQQAIVLLMLIVFWCCLASTALASPAHEHHNHQLSPFYGKAKETRPHCQLHGHTLNKPCPHLSFKKNHQERKQCTIAPDCGGSPFKNESTVVSFGTHYLANSTFEFQMYSESENIGFPPPNYFSTPGAPLTPPPRFL